MIGECQKAVDWSEQIVKKVLAERMLKDKEGKDEIIAKIIEELASHSVTLSHSRHLSAEKCMEMGLVIEKLEDNQKFQDAVLTVHHAFMHTLTATPAFKIIENHLGIAYIQSMQSLIVQAPQK